jgi:hypothetical protein
MTIIKIDNSLQSFYNVITDLKNQHPNLAFISYMGGEIGFKVVLYNSLVYNFSMSQREHQNLIVGLCFIGNTFYLKHYCDIIIEVQDIAFTYQKEDLYDEIIDNTYFPNRQDEPHSPIWFPANKPYAGPNPLHPFYKVGYYNEEYEKMLINFKFSNIFFTFFCSSGEYISGELDNLQISTNVVDLTLGKINNNYYKITTMKHLLEQKKYLDVTVNEILSCLISFRNFVKNIDKNDNIVVWIRNTTHDPSRNLPQSCYLALFDYCIQNKKHLHIFQDWQKVSIPDSEYLHTYDNFRINNSFLFDEFIKICNKSYLYIGCDSGASWMASYYTKANCLIYKSQWRYSSLINPQPLFFTHEQLIHLITTKYQ